MIRALALLATMIVLGIPTAIVCIPWAMITGNALPLYNWSQLSFASAIASLDSHSGDGAGQCPANACIFMPTTFPIRSAGIAAAHSRPNLGLPQKSLMKVPVFGFALKLGEFIPVSRDGSAIRARRKRAAHGHPRERHPHHHVR